VNGEHKITGSHLERKALIYLRQSSMAQVRHHTESTRSQYALADRAAEMGWARRDIEVIDTDLGVSGKWGVAREGFTKLVARLCTGEVGAIFGIEITRLARSNAEIARLAEFAAITGTLLIDPDAVYDPADVNDQVLPQDEPVVEQRRMVNAVGVGDEGVADPGQVQEPVPGRVVAGQPGDLQRHDDPDLAEGDLGDQALEPVPLPGYRPRHAQVAVNDPDRLPRPAQLPGTAGQVILAQRRLSVPLHLGQGRLADVNHGRPRQMRGGDLPGLTHRRPPPSRSRRPPAPWRSGPPAA